MVDDVPLGITCFWLWVALSADERDMFWFNLIGWLTMIVPALLVAWLK